MDLSFLAESDLLVKSLVAAVIVVVIGIMIRMSGRAPLRSSDDRHR